MATTNTLLATLHEAIEQKNIEQILSLYAEDAELRVIDKDHPPSQPLEMQGKEAIAEYLRDIYTRPMTHRLEDEVAADGRLAFTESCEYEDGTHVFMAATCEFRDDKIVREVDVQVWDETPTH